METASDELYNQALADIIYSIRWAAGVERKVSAHLRGLANDLVGLATSGGINSQAKIKALIQEAKAAIGDRMESAQGLFDEQISKFVEIQAERTTKALNAAVGVPVGTPLFAPAAEVTVQKITGEMLIEGAPSAEWWALQAKDIQQKFINIMRQGLSDGSTGDDMAQNVRGMMDTSTRNARALVHTSAITANNATREAVYQENAELLAGETWLATLDQKTCIECGVLDLVTWPMGEAHPVPALHWNCRCVIIPKLKSWEQLARENGGNPDVAKVLDDIPPSTRASIDRQLPETTTWSEWIGKKSPSVQKEILGPGRYNLLQKGKLTLRDMTNHQGHELSLKELSLL